ncbi:MAG: glycosyltransferase, partial [Microcoleaceae cyanobacterium]
MAVCTRDRAADLAICLEAIQKLDYPNLDILIIDNAPTSYATKELVENYPQIRYTCEPRPGLDWARNRAIIEAKGEIIAYTDDDVVVDSGWVKALAKVFAENSEVMAVTGLVVPYELETESQVLFEKCGGFGRGFEGKWYRVDPDNKMLGYWCGTGEFGTGANMAYRRAIFDHIGQFDPALDVGTVTNGGGDLEMYFRVLKEGHTLVYEPNAMVRHRHRRDYAKLKTQITNNSIGLFSYFVRSIKNYPEESLSFWKIFIGWVVYRNLIRLWISLKHPTSFPRDLIWAEIRGYFSGLTRYPKAHKKALEIAKSFGPQTSEKIPQKSGPQELTEAPERKVAVRVVEISQPLKPLTDIREYSDVQVVVTYREKPLGSLKIVNTYQPLSTSRLIEEIVNQLGLKISQPHSNQGMDIRWAKAVACLNKRYTPPTEDTSPEELPTSVSVSINLATYDRPDDLRNCLRCLLKQKTSRRVEIIVVDNHPTSGLTPPVVSEFPSVKLISESRQGLAYARNAGFVASTGDIVIATDDDVTLPP